MEGGRAAPSGRTDDRLLGWASIGGYIGRDGRTAQRYELERGLPIRRMPGAGRSTVFALRGDLDVWMQGLETSVAPLDDTSLAAQPDVAHAFDPISASTAPSAAGRARQPLRLRVLSVALGACGGVALALGGLWLAGGTSGARHDRAAAAPSQAVLDQGGAAALTARSPAGLARAIDDYTQAIVRDPSDVEAYAGLADSYNLAPEVMGMAPAEAYPRARAAAERALALDPRSAQALRAKAFVDFWWVQDRPRALGEFEHAMALQPASAQTLHWYANALAAGGDARAIGLIDRALALSPSPAMLVDKGWILLTLGKIAEARGLLQEIARTFPETPRVHDMLSSILRGDGDAEGALREARTAATLRHDDGELRIDDIAQKALDARGASAMERVMAQTRVRLVSAGQTSPFLAAAAASRVHERQMTLDMLQRARLAHEPSMASLDVNPDFAWLRDDEAFRTLAAPRRDETP